MQEESFQRALDERIPLWGKWRKETGDSMAEPWAEWRPEIREVLVKIRVQAGVPKKAGGEGAGQAGGLGAEAQKEMQGRKCGVFCSSCGLWEEDGSEYAAFNLMQNFQVRL